ncbi:disulfide isomerase, putative [Trypanosoma brucei brucei TREU927]|uniref:Disulfide isomerase, putative n=1 Tax=Trypanosoma brucei brucei (strain 927/4 GUTat10.1) TaxID=185431 RepID=Q57W47_TRYB2|nr:disulfide isomerase, putative [Trypanosoma brucei brucei TREU927]AAX70172.1 disulfide isomerase, putative [Trypanosoma brucei]AAZ11217.1 disulfide isomerase, putative [Trypanosoma brucei brucei TREU927]
MQRTKSLLHVLLVVALVLFLLITEVSVAGGVVDLGNEVREDTIPLLNDDTFDSYVFSKGSNDKEGRKRGPWLIFFFAPWCGHCKAALPKYADANLQLAKLGVQHARFATVNAVKSPELALRFRVKVYPTLIYTTGKAENWHVYRGALTPETLMKFATQLHLAGTVGSFADLTSSPDEFVRAHRQDMGRRVPMYVYLPPTGSRSANAPHQREELVPGQHGVGEGEGQQGVQANNSKSIHEEKHMQKQDRLSDAREARWNVAVDAAASMEKIRFGVIYGDDVPSAWAETGITPYIAVLEAAQRCKGSGPDGALVLVDSDAYKQPQCYEGPWFEESVNIPQKSGAESVTPLLHPSFIAFFMLNGLHAVERASSSLLSAVTTTNHHYLGLLITNGPITQTDTNMLPALREVVQERNEARRAVAVGLEPQRRVSLAYVDGRTHEAWRTQYKVKLEELPAFVVVDPRRNKVYRLRRHTPHFEVIKFFLPWPRGGEQQSVIVSFIADVERGVAVGEKMTFVGEVAEHLLRLPGVEFLYEVLEFEDSLLVVVVLALFVFAIVLLIVLVVEPVFERRADERMTGYGERDTSAVEKKRN